MSPDAQGLPAEMFELCAPDGRKLVLDFSDGAELRGKPANVDWDLRPRDGLCRYCWQPAPHTTESQVFACSMMGLAMRNLRLLPDGSLLLPLSQELVMRAIEEAEAAKNGGS